MLLSAQVPIYARALDTRHAAELKAAGAGTVVTANVEAGTSLATHVLLHLGGEPPGVLRAESCASC